MRHSTAKTLDTWWITVCKGTPTGSPGPHGWQAAPWGGSFRRTSPRCASCTAPAEMAAISCTGRSGSSWASWCNAPKGRTVSRRSARCPPAKTCAACSQCERWLARPWRCRTAWRTRSSAGCHESGSFPRERPAACGGRPPLPEGPSKSRCARVWPQYRWWCHNPLERWRYESESGGLIWGLGLPGAEDRLTACKGVSLANGSFHGLPLRCWLPSYRRERPQTLSHL